MTFERNKNTLSSESCCHFIFNAKNLLRIREVEEDGLHALPPQLLVAGPFLNINETIKDGEIVSEA